MPEPVQIAAFIREFIATSWPSRFDPAELRDDVSLGEDGLSLDSLEVVQVVLACEERCERRSTEELFKVLPVTIERLARHFASQ